MHTFADRILKPDGILYADVDEATKDGKEFLAAIAGEALDSLGYFLKPSELFSELARRGNADGKHKFILDDLTKVLNNIAQSTMGTDSEEEFDHLFEDRDLTSSKLGKAKTPRMSWLSKCCPISTRSTLGWKIPKPMFWVIPMNISLASLQVVPVKKRASFIPLSRSVRCWPRLSPPAKRN
jgi:hypothetical protein